MVKGRYEDSLEKRKELGSPSGEIKGGKDEERRPVGHSLGVFKIEKSTQDEE